METVKLNEEGFLRGAYKPTVRRSGLTTRLADVAIQSLFEGHSVIVVDHFDSKNSNRDLEERILKRLDKEHNIRLTSGRILKSYSGGYTLLTLNLTK